MVEAYIVYQEVAPRVIRLRELLVMAWIRLLSKVR